MTAPADPSKETVVPPTTVQREQTARARLLAAELADLVVEDLPPGIECTPAEGA